MLKGTLYVTAGMLAVAAPAGPPQDPAQARTLAVIVHKERPESSLSRTLLVQIYRGEIRHWPANRQLIQFALPPGSSAAKDEFIRKVLQMTPAEFDREWRGKRYRGESALIPNPDLTRSEVMQAVATQRHFVAVVELDWLRSIDERFRQDIKILNIDGKSPDDGGYPLRLGLLVTPRDPVRVLAQWVAAALTGARGTSVSTTPAP